MTEQTVGRRGIDPALLSRLATPAPASVRSLPAQGPSRLPATGASSFGRVASTPRPATTRADEIAVEDGTHVWARIPFLTFVLIIVFAAGYGLEQRFAVDAAPDGSIGIRSLIAYGAVSYDRVFADGEWWRIVLAPLLHGSVSHQLGNCVALFFVGLRLEPMLGRSWFLAVFCLSALGGVAGSLIGNPHAQVSVGASGAITGLIGALFVASFHHKATELSDSAAMRRTALRFGVPALLPLIFGISGGVDYSAHAGGAVTGAAVALLICAFWLGDERRPRLSEAIVLVPVVYVSCAVVAAAIAYRQFPTAADLVQMAKAEPFIPDKDLPKDFDVGDQRSRDLAERYAKDPRAHLIRGVYLLKASRAGAAEFELRQSIDLAKAGPYEDGIRQYGQPLLAVALKQMGRTPEARELAAPGCRRGRPSEIVDMLKRYDLCH
ncbi:MAG: rhomboid family intramembrane serine protease [Ancalomicrobiaceae bacterium]|nr:rhomboid family intramembrane serine protease [Ancalomicrobiaceae bacterium]